MGYARYYLTGGEFPVGLNSLRLDSPCNLLVKLDFLAACIAPHQYLSGPAISPLPCIQQALRPNDSPSTHIGGGATDFCHSLILLLRLVAHFSISPLLSSSLIFLHSPIFPNNLPSRVTVGLTAYMLHRIAGLLFDDEDRLIGPAAGLAYIVFSLANDGMASNSEVFLNMFTVLGLLLALLAVRGAERPRLGLMLAAGLVLGLGVQVKQTILFDMLAFLVGFYLLTTVRLADLGPHLRVTAPSLAALAAVSTLPTIAVIVLYAITGHWSDWAMANLAAQRGFVDDPGQPLEFDAALWAMAEQAPLWFGTLLTALLSRWLVRDETEAQAVRFLLIWAAAILLLQFFLRIAADHYFLQFLPPLCLLNGLLLGRGLLTNVAGQRARAGLLAVVGALTLFGVSKNQLVNTAYVLRDRMLRGQAWAADTPRRIAADLKPVLRPSDAVYEVGFLPIIYHLTDAEIPTRFAFTGLPHARYAGRDGCPWVPQEIEMRRVLDTRPRFIVVEQGVFCAELDPKVGAILRERLARDYRLRWR